MDKLTNSEDAKRFLLSLGLHVGEGVVKQVVNILSGTADGSIYSLYATRPDKPPPVCGKGTAYKIKGLYDEGDLQPYLNYLSDSSTIGEAKLEQTIKAEHDVPKETRVEQKPYKETPHKRKMRKLAGYLMTEISLPSIMDSFIAELKPGQLIYADPWGRRQGCPIIVAENGEISVELSIEGREEIGHLHKRLRRHLETGGFPEVLDKISDWRKGVGQYLKQCHNLLAVVIGEIQGGKAKIPNEGVELNKKAGFKLSFPATICGNAVETASGHSLGFLYDPEALTNSLWLLRYGAFGIYLAQTKKELERFEYMHKELTAKYASERAAKDIAELRQKLYNIRDQIYLQLQVFEGKECVPGYCELCSQ